VGGAIGAPLGGVPLARQARAVSLLLKRVNSPLKRGQLAARTHPRKRVAIEASRGGELTARVGMHARARRSACDVRPCATVFRWQLAAADMLQGNPKLQAEAIKTLKARVKGRAALAMATL